MVFDANKWRQLTIYGNCCVGVSSLCQDGYHSVMIDYDHISRSELISDVKRLQEKFKLGDATICRTANGWHCYIPTKVTYRKLCRILKESICDVWYKDSRPRKSMKMVILRISSRAETPPPEFETVIDSRWNGNFEASLAHWAFLRWFFGAPLRYPAKNDGSNKILVYLYKTLRN